MDPDPDPGGQKRFVLDPTPNSDPNPDLKHLFRIRIRPKVSDPAGSDTDSTIIAKMTHNKKLKKEGNFMF